MKKTILTLLPFLLFIVTNAQVKQFLSLQSTVLWKDSKGHFQKAKESIIKQVYIQLNPVEKKVGFFSKEGLLDTDTFSLKKEIYILNTSAENNKLFEFNGIDNTGKRCFVKLNFNSNANELPVGNLRIEYENRAEVYTLNNINQKPKLNKS